MNYAVEKTYPEEGMTLYTRIYWYVYDRQYKNKLFKESKIDWEKMKQGMDDLVARYPVPWNTSYCAKLSCLAGDAEKTREYMDMLPPEPDLSVWETEYFFNYCKNMGKNKEAGKAVNN